MEPYETICGHTFRTPLCWTELGERKIMGLKMITETEAKVRLIRDQLKTEILRGS